MTRIVKYSALVGAAAMLTAVVAGLLVSIVERKQEARQLDGQKTLPARPTAFNGRSRTSAGRSTEGPTIIRSWMSIQP